MTRTPSLIAGVLAAALLAAGPAAAHSRLVKSDPASNATVAAPKAITLTFSGKLTAAFSTFKLETIDKPAEVAVKTNVAADGKTVTVTPQKALAKGGYKLSWNLATADGHKMPGTMRFTVK